MQKAVERGQAPKGVDRVDPAHGPTGKPHVHYDDGTASNIDGTVHDAGKGAPNATSTIRKWLEENGWVAPK